MRTIPAPFGLATFRRVFVPSARYTYSRSVAALGRGSMLLGSQFAGAVQVLPPWPSCTRWMLMICAGVQLVTVGAMLAVKAVESWKFVTVAADADPQLNAVAVL